MMNLFKQFMSKSRISNNTAPKLASLFFAVLLWVYVMDIENPETLRTFKDVPVQLVHIEELQDSGLVLMNSQDYSVDVMIEGRRSDVLDVKKSEIEITSDLLGFGKGTNSIPIDLNLIADNVKITKISKNEIKVDLDRIVSVAKTVEITINDELPNDYKAKQVMVNPQQILVVGPETLVNSVTKLVGEIEIVEKSTDLLKKVPIKAVDSDGNVVSRVQPKVAYVDLELSIDKFKTVNLKGSVVGSVSEGYEYVGISLNPQSIMINGEENVVDSVDLLRTKSIDISNITKKTTKTVELILPEGVHKQYLATPVMATIDVEEIVTKTFSYHIDDISILNLKSELEVRLLGPTPYFEISVEARKSLIEDLEKSDLLLNLDLANHISGRYSKKLNIDSNVENYELENLYKELNIEIFEKETTSENTEVIDSDELVNDEQTT